MPFLTLSTRELAHAFVFENYEITKAVQNTFGIQLIVTVIVTAGFALFFVFFSHFVPPKGAMLIGLALTIVQLSASWADTYRVANRSDYVSSIVATIANVSLITMLLALTNYGMTIMPICIIYFGVPALAQLFLFFHLVIVGHVHLRFEASPMLRFRKKLLEALPLSLIPAVDYIKIYLSGIIVLIASNSESYILYYTSILYIARLINPLTLITRPLMPAYIDALNRKDVIWLSGLKKMLFGTAVAGAIMAFLLAILLTPKILSLVYPPEVGEISFFYVILCCLFAYGHALVNLLSPLYVGAYRASFYGLVNLAFTVFAIAIGAFFCSSYGAFAMMGSLSAATTACAIFLLVDFLYRR
jgi:O-antigen/teichoic acid export membrane protein